MRSRSACGGRTHRRCHGSVPRSDPEHQQQDRKRQGQDHPARSGPAPEIAARPLGRWEAPGSQRQKHGRAHEIIRSPEQRQKGRNNRGLFASPSAADPQIVGIGPPMHAADIAAAATTMMVAANNNGAAVARKHQHQSRNPTSTRTTVLGRQVRPIPPDAAAVAAVPRISPMAVMVAGQWTPERAKAHAHLIGKGCKRIA